MSGRSRVSQHFLSDRPFKTGTNSQHRTFCWTELGCVDFRCISCVLYMNIYVRICAVKRRVLLSLRNQGQEALLIQRDGIMRSFPVRIDRLLFLFPAFGIRAKSCRVSPYVRTLWNEQYLCTTVRTLGGLWEECLCYSRWCTWALYSIHVETTVYSTRFPIVRTSAATHCTIVFKR